LQPLPRRQFNAKKKGKASPFILMSAGRKEGKMARERVNNIDFDEIKKIASKKGLTFRTLSEKIGFEQTYLTHRRQMGWLWSNTVELIAMILEVDKHTLLKTEPQKAESKETEKGTGMNQYIIEQFGELQAAISMQTKMINNLIDDLIVLHREIKQYKDR
jgi:hypothetical protein